MSGPYTRETFFRPAAVERQPSALPAVIYNALQLLVSRSETGCVFVPIRGMQYQAVAERDEVVFVDSQGGYAHQDGVGGRLIRIAWRPLAPQSRDSLGTPVPCEIIYYFSGLRETQWRLVSEIQPALNLLIERQRQQYASQAEPRVIPFRSPHN